MVLDLVAAGEVPGTKKCIDAGNKPPRKSMYAPLYMTSASANPDSVTLKGLIKRLCGKVKKLREGNEVLRAHIESLESRVEKLENIQSGKRAAWGPADGCRPEKRPALES